MKLRIVNEKEGLKAVRKRKAIELHLAHLEAALEVARATQLLDRGVAGASDGMLADASHREETAALRAKAAMARSNISPAELREAETAHFKQTLGALEEAIIGLRVEIENVDPGDDVPVPLAWQLAVHELAHEQVCDELDRIAAQEKAAKTPKRKAGK